MQTSHETHGHSLTLPRASGIDHEFAAWWNLPGESVEPPNQRRGGISGVSFCLPSEGAPNPEPVYLKRQVNHVYRDWRSPITGRPTSEREAYFLARLSRLHLRVPRVLYFGSCRIETSQFAALATEALVGFNSLEEVYSGKTSGRPDKKADLAIRQSLASYLSNMHAAHMQHGCLYPKHIFVRQLSAAENYKAEIALIDLEKMRYRINRRAAASRDLAQFNRHQNFWSGTDWDEFIDMYSHPGKS